MTCRSSKDNDEIFNRLNKIEGQIRGIKNMIQNDRDCMDIIHQISSVTSALKSVWQIMAAKHLNNCIDKMDTGERMNLIDDIIENLQKLK